MATINYKCDTCLREVELIENIKGLTTVGPCIITNNCYGRLYPTSRNPNNLRESIPKYDRDLEDFSKRGLFFGYNQSVESDVWTVKHNLSDSCVVIVYNIDGTIVPTDSYSQHTANGVTKITFSAPRIGTVHILSRAGSMITTYASIDATGSLTKCSYNDSITFAIPRYITKYNSGAYPSQPGTVDYTPPRDLTASSTILIEIEVKKPNEPAVTCDETLSTLINPSPWVPWTEILVKNRKQYILKSKNIRDFKIFKNTNDQSINIPDGTTLKIKRIAYSDVEVFTAIPDRGLLVLLANDPYTTADKELNKLIDCGEMVDANLGYFTFRDGELYAFDDNIENTYPKISKNN